MKKLLLFVFLLSISSSEIYSIDTAAVKYYPLAVGNSWTYSHFWYPYGGGYYYKETVTGTTITNGHLYYTITIKQGISQTTELRRIDSVKNVVRVYSTNGCPFLQNEISLDSLSAHLGDSSQFHCGSYNEHYRLNDTSVVTLFGLSRKLKSYHFSAFEDAGYRNLAKGIGFFYYVDYGMNTLNVNLLGCVIDGVLYGDTSLTAINQISTEIPNNFSLSQNYPNPFNPSTNIKFQIAKSTNVKLTIYDALGKEVETLVDKKLEPGEYQADFDGTNLPSGVYFYKLVVDNTNNGNAKYIETKKMVLIK